MTAAPPPQHGPDLPGRGDLSAQGTDWVAAPPPQPGWAGDPWAGPVPGWTPVGGGWPAPPFAGAPGYPAPGSLGHRSLAPARPVDGGRRRTALTALAGAVAGAAVAAVVASSLFMAGAQDMGEAMGEAMGEEVADRMSDELGLGLGGAFGAPYPMPGSSGPVEQSEPVAPGELGPDPVLDAYAQQCFTGDLQACDDLYYSSAPGSDYEEYGMSCGRRVEPGTVFVCTELD